ncbi:MAG: hypothetical protein MI862_12795 [Desulfobacterales bacterium]|nr:hypothetical protein [Desulfobacterales bacterium]
MLLIILVVKFQKAPALRTVINFNKRYFLKRNIGIMKLIRNLIFLLFFLLIGTSHADDPCNCGTLEIQLKMASNTRFPPGGVWVWFNSQKHNKLQVDSTGWIQLTKLPTAKCNQSGSKTIMLSVQGWMEEIWDIHIPDCNGTRYFNAVLSKCRGGWIHHGSGDYRDKPQDSCWQ